MKIKLTTKLTLLAALLLSCGAMSCRNKNNNASTYDKGVVINGVSGCKFTDKQTGASLFLPAAGGRMFIDGTLFYETTGFYWSRTKSENPLIWNLVDLTISQAGTTSISTVTAIPCVLWKKIQASIISLKKMIVSIGYVKNTILR